MAIFQLQGITGGLPFRQQIAEDALYIRPRLQAGPYYAQSGDRTQGLRLVRALLSR